MNKKDYGLVFGTSLLSSLISSILWVYVFHAEEMPAPSPALPQENLAEKGDFEGKIIQSVQKASPAVVSIRITQDVPVYERRQSGSIFDNFFPRYEDTGKTEEKEVGGGSGFLVSTDGYIITNRHVVSLEEASYTVQLPDEREFEAEVLAKDPLNDLAVLKIKGDDFPFLSFSSLEPQVGQSVLAIGNPLLQFENSVSLGIVSGLSRSIQASDGQFGRTELLEGVIQTDAAINPGNSGGPLLNSQGEVIGVNVAVANAENIGFSIPASEAKKVFESVKEFGEIRRPYLGVRYMPINKKVQEANDLDVDYGVLLRRGAKEEELAVIPGSPADKAGLQENDIILEINGEKLSEKPSFSRRLANFALGDSLELLVLRKGKKLTLRVTLEALK